jgi:uncharacterized membrane protein
MLARFEQNKALPRWIAVGMAILFVAVFIWLNSRQYLTFQLRAPDVARFDQAIWNTLQGRFLATTIKENTILANHFSPFMALLSPLFLLWSDARVLFAVQIVGIAVAGLILYKIVEEKYALLGLLFLLAFYLNPALHQVTLLELRRVTLAMPFLALMLYGLYKGRRGLMLVGIIFALLCKENLGLIVAMVGLYLIVRERDWKWGAPIALLGAIWSVGMVLWVIPALSPRNYPQLRYFSDWGGSLGAVALNMTRSPLRVLQTMFDGSSLRAIWRLLLPLAVVLPFLAVDILIIVLPLVGMMLLSNIRDMHQLQRWYLAPVLPVLFAAVAIGINRLSRRYAPWAFAALIGATILSFFLYSQAPLGPHFEPHRYTITERQQRAWEVIEAVPDEAIVAAQEAFVVPLAHREQIYNFPWFVIGQENIEYFVLGRDFGSYPVPGDEIGWEIENLIAEPNIVVEMEVDGIYLLHQGGRPLPSTEFNRVAEGAIKLSRAEVALADESGLYQTVEGEPLSVAPGQKLRITLYWEALATSEAERTVSVRVEDAAGALVAQRDSLPSSGARPTSWWQPGWNFRDVYYLEVAPDVTPGPASIDLVLYDTFTFERVPFDGEDVLQLMQIELVD